MPPHAAQRSLSAISKCRSAPTPAAALRAFSTSSSTQGIGPESPKFIEIPQPPQRFQRHKKDIKGVLPVPRNLFARPNRNGDKTSPLYLAQTTPEPTKTIIPDNDYTAWKQRMAAKRRQNLREGLVQLKERKDRNDFATARLSTIRQENRTTRLEAPPRDSDRLTAPTIRSSMSTLQHGILPDPDRGARLAAASASVQAKAAAMEEARRDALHTLYIHARSFITTEQQLDAEIEKVFSETPFENMERADAQNIWDAAGAPPTVAEMLSEVSNTQRRAVEFYAPPAVKTGKRMKRIAEELTGGKMDVE